LCDVVHGYAGAVWYVCMRVYVLLLELQWDTLSAPKYSEHFLAPIL